MTAADWGDRIVDIVNNSEHATWRVKQWRTFAKIVLDLRSLRGWSDRNLMAKLAQRLIAKTALPPDA